MLFNSLTFLLFFGLVGALHYLAKSWSMRKNVLLLASYIFYAAWNPPYVFILLFSTTLDWWLAGRLDRSDKPDVRKRWLAISLLSNLGLLGFFKYGGFLLGNFQFLAAALGLHYQPPEWNIVLPIGISFYTFASLSYTIDVYRRQIRSEPSLRDYALFVSFFPHLVAGPIVRASLLLPQMHAPRPITRDRIGWGLALVLIGLFCKTVLADALFAPVVDEIYAQAGQYGALDTWTGVLAFSGQIYFDFSAYSLCAIGLALCFGFEFPDNFRFPYAASGFSDFWRRWHISLSSWLRDYLYIPLGGNRAGSMRTRINLLLTMLIGGLWHGASWMFVAWGGLHGLYLIGERVAARVSTVQSRPAMRILLILFTFLVITLTWIPFRAHSVATAMQVTTGLFGGHGGKELELLSRILVLASIAAMLRWQIALRNSSLEEWFGILPDALKVVWLSICLIGIFLFSGGDERAFIYFQF